MYLVAASCGLRAALGSVIKWGPRCVGGDLALGNLHQLTHRCFLYPDIIPSPLRNPFRIQDHCSVV